MTTKPLLLLAALTLCCCIASLHALPTQGCRCIRSIYSQVPLKVIKKLELIPISGHCRRTEIIITRRNGSKVCVKPEEKWVNSLLSNLQK
ncbi:interleukin-8 [Anarrhichthys ocellatus]|uniref:interleukin-8 n=1 Tax=Anarrhichthys ocellatus TaxID=433405 RepID=UPI0012EE7B3D|nr:C-X-C motif chemokine 13 [Anarrhichthys ocellatus]